MQAHGTSIPEGHGVWMAGYQVPVDNTGGFVAGIALTPLLPWGRRKRVAGKVRVPAFGFARTGAAPQTVPRALDTSELRPT